MPCKDCESNAKLRSVSICPDPWSDGARSEATSAGRKKSENKLLTTKARYTPYGKAAGLGLDQKCTVCKKQLAAGGKYCGECAHKKGVCYICGKQVFETEFYTHHENPLLDKKKEKSDVEVLKPQISTKKKPKDEDPLDFAEVQAERARAKAAEQQQQQQQQQQQGRAQAQGAAAQAPQGGGHAQAQAQQQPAAQQEQQQAAQEIAILRTAGTWSELKCGESVYYYDSASQATQWTAPSDFDGVPMAAPAAPAAPAKPAPTYEQTGGWQELQAADGRTYYFHAAGNLTTWKKPATYKL